MFFCINNKQQEDILQGTTISHTYLKSFLAWAMLLGKENLDPIFKASLFSSSPQLSANFQRPFYPEIIQTSSSTLDVSPPRMKKWNKGSRSLILAPPPQKKNKSIEAHPGKGKSHSQWTSFSVPSVSSSSTRFPLQAARKAVLSKGSGGLKFRINKRIRTSWFSWFNVSKLGWR